MDQTGGGNDSLLEAPRVDVAMKVYQGGGLDVDKDTKPTYKGVTGMVRRHQVSLYTTPSHKVQLKVYKGGGSSPTFRGEGITIFQENKEFYKTLLATGKYYLEKVLGSAEGELAGEEADLKATLDKFGVVFYGETTSTFDVEYKTQLLVFSTSDPEAPGRLGILILTVDNGWTITLPAEELGTLTSLHIGPYMIRDPDALTADTFFEHIQDGTDTHAKSERLYMKDVIFGGYPLSLLKKVLTERREDFFEKVWKPLIDYNILDNLTFQLSSPLKGAREFLSNLRDEQIQEISRRLDEYLEGQGQEADEDDVQADEDEEGEEWEAEEDDAQEEEYEQEEEEEQEEQEEEEQPKPKKKKSPVAKKLKTALASLDTILPKEVEGNSHLDAQCESIRNVDTTGDPLFEYVKSLYIVLTDTNIEEFSNDLPKLQAFVEHIKAIQIPQVPEEMKDIIVVFKEYMASLDALISKIQVSGKPKRGVQLYQEELGELHAISDMLKMYICRGYLFAQSKGPPSKASPAPRRGGSRKTRKKKSSKSSDRI